MALGSLAFVCLFGGNAAQPIARSKPYWFAAQLKGKMRKGRGEGKIQYKTAHTKQFFFLL